MESVPLDFLGDLRRTHMCGELRPSDVGKRAILMGWVHRRRNLGGVIFIHLRDRDGVTQLVFNESNAELHRKVELLGSEYVIAVEGLVEGRSAETVNPTIPTGEVEVAVEKLWILNESRTPPFPMEEEVDVKEEARLKYRYVDLRRPQMQRNIILRSKVSFAVRQTMYITISVLTRMEKSSIIVRPAASLRFTLHEDPAAVTGNLPPGPHRRDASVATSIPP